MLAAVSYLLILDLFFNFFRYFVSKSWHEQCLWGGAAQVSRGGFVWFGGRSGAPKCAWRGDTLCQCARWFVTWLEVTLHSPRGARTTHESG